VLLPGKEGILKASRRARAHSDRMQRWAAGVCRARRDDTMNCRECGSENRDGAAECSSCGSLLSEEMPTEVLPSAGRAGAARQRRREDSDSDAGTDSGPTDPASATLTTAPQAARPASRGAGSAMPGQTDALQPGTKLGNRYEIVKVLGIGGMGVVYQARDITLDRDVALKVIRPEMATDKDVMDRFRREILLASRITHKHILRIHDLGESGGLSYISMAFVEGESLRDILRREGFISVERALPIAMQICDALQAAHDAGVVHRDLKPHNVLIDKEGNSYLADFGISRSMKAGETMTQTGAILGTIDYMCPEQARGETPDHRGDIYSFGLVLYNMLTGTLPFKTENALSSMMLRVHQDVPKVTGISQSVPPWMSGIVGRCCARNPENRYQKASHVKRDLEARKASFMFGRRLRKPRFWLQAAAVVAGAAIVIGGASTGIRYLMQERQAGPVAVKASLAMLPFQNGTGEERFDWVRTGLPDLLRSDLQQAKALRLVGQDRVESILDGLQIGDRRELRDQDLVRIAGLLGVDNVMTGRIMRAGDRFRVEARVRTALDNSVSEGAPISIEGSGEAALFDMMDELSGRIRDELGVAAGWGETDQGVAELSTDSVEALGLYSEGLSLVRAGNNLEAAGKLEAAVAMEPQFAAAGALLAETYDRLGYDEKAIAAADRAAQGLQQASPFETARVRAVQAQLKGELDEAIGAYRSIVDLTPNNAEAHYSLALALEENGALEEALAVLRKLVELDPKHPDGHYALGRVQSKLGNLTDAVAELNLALGLHNQAGNQEGKASALNGLGNAYYALGQDDEAMRNFSESLQIRRAIGDRRGEASALINTSIVATNQGRHQDALVELQKALAIFEEIGDQALLSEAYSTLGDLYESLGQGEKALAAYQESLKVIRESGDQSALARTLNNIGFLNAALGKYLEAYFFQKEALERSREMGRREHILQVLIGIAWTEQVQGRHEESLKYYLEGLSMAREMGFKDGIIVLLANMSIVQQDQGEYGAALALLTEAEREAREKQDSMLLADCLIYLGNVRRLVGDLNGAEASLQEAMTLARDLDLPEPLAKVQLARAELLRLQSLDREAAEARRQATDYTERSGDYRLRLMARLAGGRASASVADLTALAKEAAESGLVPVASRSHLALARIHSSRGDHARALSEAEKAVAAAEPPNERHVLLQARHLAAQAHLAAGNSRAAAEQLAAALGPLEDMVENLPSDLRPVFLSQSLTDAYLSEAERVFRETGRSSEGERLEKIRGQ
jgi:tetratricopeptide (TPR) repeat protein